MRPFRAPDANGLLTEAHTMGANRAVAIPEPQWFSRLKLASGPCGLGAPSYMSLNYRNIAGV